MNLTVAMRNVVCVNGGAGAGSTLSISAFPHCRDGAQGRRGFIPRGGGAPWTTCPPKPLAKAEVQQLQPRIELIAHVNCQISN